MNYVPQNGFSVSFWFRRTGDSIGEQGLVSNGGCDQENSIEVVSTSKTTLSVRVKTETADGDIHYGGVDSIEV